MRSAKRKGTSFGGGTYTKRHDQGYQALTAGVVIGLSVSILTLHHFGFGLALIFALTAAAICVVAGSRGAASVYVVGLALFAGIILTPMLGVSNDPTRLNTFTVPIAIDNPANTEYQHYVREGMGIDPLYLRRHSNEFNTGAPKQSPLHPENDTTQLPSPYSRQLYAL